LVSYNRELDITITKYLYNNQKGNFAELLNVCRELNPKTSKRELSQHLKKLENEQKIKRDPLVAGMPRYSQLTDVGRLEWDLEIFDGAKTKRGEQRDKTKDHKKWVEETQTQRKKKAYLLLFYIGAVGGRRLKENTKAEPGDIGMYDEKRKNIVAYSVYELPGVGVSDFFVEPRSIVTQFGALSYLNFSDPKEAESYFRLLEKQKPQLIMPIDEVDGEKRYGVADPLLAEYITDCWLFFSSVLFRLEDTWQYIREPTKKEVDWYLSLYGREETMQFFLKAQNMRKRGDERYRESRDTLLQKQQQSQQQPKHTLLPPQKKHRVIGYKKIKRDEIKRQDNMIRKRFQNLQDKYGDLQKKFAYPTIQLRELVYPDFLRELQENKKI
jgi:hypothetical protein